MEVDNSKATPSEDDLRRYQLQTLLEKILGSRNVYFQPPSGVRMQYPAIVYQLDRMGSRYADNAPYSRFKAYQVTWIGTNPDSDIPDLIGSLPLSSWVRFYVADNLNHHVYRLYW